MSPVHVAAFTFQESILPLNAGILIFDTDSITFIKEEGVTLDFGLTYRPAEGDGCSFGTLT